MADLVLLGVVHRDPAGQERLLKFLKDEKPDAVGLALSPTSMELRERYGAELKTRLAASLRTLGREAEATQIEQGGWPRGGLGDLARAFEPPFELMGARAYAQESGAEVALLDEAPMSLAAYHAACDPLVSTAEVAALLERERESPPIEDPIPEQYALARRYFGSAHFFRHHFSDAEKAAMAARADTVAKHLEPLAARHAKVVVVTGWEQLIDGGIATLWTRLKGRAKRTTLA